VEFDEPTTLLNNPDSFFSGLVNQSGDQSDALRALVFEAARKKGIVDLKLIKFTQSRSPARIASKFL
jgi:hypothetical protein